MIHDEGDLTAPYDRVTSDRIIRGSDGSGEAETLLPVLESVGLPPASLYVNLDVIDYLQSHTEEELFDLIGKLKDLMQ